MKKKLLKTAKGLIVSSAVIGTGASVLGNFGAAGAQGQQALGTLSGALPPIASASGGGIIIGELRNLSRAARKRRKR